MLSDEEIEAAAKVMEKLTTERGFLRWDEAARAALSAAARVREEANNECGEAAHPAPQSSGMVKALEWVASDDWEYRWIADLYAIEDQGKNWSTDRYWLYYNGQRLGKFGTFDAASSAAQADYERRILSALTADKPEQAAPSGWLPIETAPKDGTYVLLSNEHGTWVGHYVERYTSGYRPKEPWHTMMMNHWHMKRYASTTPTHWMPLPAAPTAGGGDG